MTAELPLQQAVDPLAERFWLASHSVLEIPDPSQTGWSRPGREIPLSLLPIRPLTERGATRGERVVSPPQEKPT